MTEQYRIQNKCLINWIELKFKRGLRETCASQVNQEMEGLEDRSESVKAYEQQTPTLKMHYQQTVSVLT